MDSKNCLKDGTYTLRVQVHLIFVWKVNQPSLEKLDSSHMSIQLDLVRHVLNMKLELLENMVFLKHKLREALRNLEDVKNIQQKQRTLKNNSNIKIRVLKNFRGLSVA